MGDEFGKVPDDEATALRIASVCKPEDIDNGNLEGMIYLALREANSKLKRGAEGDGKVCPDCNEPCSSLAGNPAKWPVPQPDTQQPGKIRWHHMGCLAAKDERISSLEATVAKAFLRCQELEEAVKPFAKAFDEMNPAFHQDCDHACIWDTGAENAIKVGDLRVAYDLCHADPVPGCETSSAEGPPHPEDGESTQ